MEGGFPAGLQSGVVLCELMNALRPKSIKKRAISRKDAKFDKLGNIKNFLVVCKDVGMRESNLFSSIDLYDGTVCRGGAAVGHGRGPGD